MFVDVSMCIFQIEKRKHKMNVLVGIFIEIVPCKST